MGLRKRNVSEGHSNVDLHCDRLLRIAADLYKSEHEPRHNPEGDQDIQEARL